LSAVSSKPGSCKSRRLQGLRKDPHEHAVFSFPTAMRKGADVFSLASSPPGGFEFLPSGRPTKSEDRRRCYAARK